jgi:hypothetical protein
LVEPLRTKSISKILLTNDLTSAVMREAREAKVEMIVSYHPPLFSAIKRLTSTNVKQRLVMECIENGIAVFSHHTAIDAKAGGVNDWLASSVGHGTIRPLTPAHAQAPPTGEAVKIITFVPTADVEKVRSAMCAAGAGRIGNYTSCSFTTAGRGSFQGNEHSNPTIGKPGVLEFVDEVKLEMVCAKAALAAVINAMKSSHPCMYVRLGDCNSARRRRSCL